jgi:hypothetical protein
MVTMAAKATQKITISKLPFATKWICLIISLNLKGGLPRFVIVSAASPRKAWRMVEWAEASRKQPQLGQIYESALVA